MRIAGVAFRSQLWNAIGNLIDRDQFYSMFSSECAELTLPYENYHMDTAFENANKEWTMELMVLVADRMPKSSRMKARPF